MQEDADHSGWRPGDVVVPGRFGQIVIAIGFVESAADPHRNWFEIELALRSLEHIGRSLHGDGRLSERERDDLLRAIVRLRAAVRLRLPVGARRQFDIGMQAAVGLVVHWSETDEQRDRRHPHVVEDMRSCLRMARNTIHNLRLAEWIEDRRHEREADTIGTLDRKARRAG